MKPPPRARSLPDRYLNKKTDQKQRRHTKIICTWKRKEQRNLLMALRKLLKVVGDTGEIDYAFLKKHVPSRSISEIHSVVEALKTKIISLVTFELVKQVREERKVKNNIDLWVDMSSIVAGVQEEPISSAFSQTFMVSSTEPRSIRNSHPLRNHNPVKQKTRGDGAILLRAAPQPPTLGQLHGITKATPVLLLRNQPKSPTTSPAPGPSPGPSLVAGAVAQQHPLLTACESAASTPRVGKLENAPASATLPTHSAAPSSDQATSGPAKQGRSKKPIHAAKAVSSGLALAKHSEQASVQPAGPTRDSGGTESPTASTASAPISLAPSVAKFDSPMCTVDFEKLYCYLSAVEKKECTLSPMESAVVLDLLMSLPEELPLLPCNKLQQHFIQVYSCLSHPANHKAAMEMYACKQPNTAAEGEVVEEQNIILDANNVPFHADSYSSKRNVDTCAVRSSTKSQGSGAEGSYAGGSGPVGSASDQQGECKTSPPNSQSRESKSRNKQPENWPEELVCPLNPFLVPLNLLKRVKE